MRPGAALVVLVVFVPGCRDRRDAVPAIDGSTQGAHAGAVQPHLLSVGKGRVLERGIASMKLGRLVVSVTDLAASCTSAVPSDTAHAMMTMEIPPGPGARFFAGSTVGLRAFGAIDGERFDYVPSDNIVEIEPFVLAKGARIRLHVDGPLGSGVLEEQICDVDEAPRPLPETAPDEPAAGTLDGQPFRAKKALVSLEGGDGGSARFEVLRLYQDETVACGRGSSKSPGLYVHRFGVGARRPLIGSAQPARADAFNNPIERAQATSEMPAWIRFDRLSFAPGSSIAGALAVEMTNSAGGPPTRITGHFEAEVCPP